MSIYIKKLSRGDLYLRKYSSLKGLTMFYLNSKIYFNIDKLLNNWVSFIMLYRMFKYVQILRHNEYREEMSDKK